MIGNEQEYKVTLERIEHFQKQIEHLRRTKASPENYRKAVGGFIAELDRMSLEVRDYLLSHPRDLAEARA
ncbi:MAG: hypothetical protein HY706_13165 [Candidatus Hydrogenedentes bacterium]|nr:hypothetical protein [Candidatus Hydrogenedentota bacterium]